MDKVFKVKSIQPVYRWLILLAGILFLTFFYVAATSYFRRTFFLCYIIFLLLDFFYSMRGVRKKYILRDDELLIYTSIFSKPEVFTTNGIRSIWRFKKGLQIMHDKGPLFVQPEQEEAFLDAIKEIIPNIEIE